MFYVLVNVAYYTMMSPAELLQSEAVAVVSGGGVWFKGPAWAQLSFLDSPRRRLLTAPCRAWPPWSPSWWPCPASGLSTGASLGHPGRYAEPEGLWFIA